MASRGSSMQRMAAVVRGGGCVVWWWSWVLLALDGVRVIRQDALDVAAQVVQVAGPLREVRRAEPVRDMYISCTHAAAPPSPHGVMDGCEGSVGA